MPGQAFLSYDKDSCVNTPVAGSCWRCLSYTLIEREITAHLLTNEGVSTRRVRWRQCRTCGHMGPAESEEP